MSQTSKPMPVILKVLIGFLVLGLIYRMSVHQPRRDGQGSDYATPASSPVEERRSGGYDAAPQADSARQADGAGSQLAQYQAQYSQVLARINQCEAQNNAYAAQQLAAGEPHNAARLQPICAAVDSTRSVAEYLHYPAPDREHALDGL